MVTLYRAPWSTNCERVALALAYKRMAVDSVWIEYSDRTLVEQVSGQPLVPVVSFDGEIVYDSTAILRRLEELAPEPPLFPRDPARRARLDVFLEWFNGLWKRPPNEIEAELSGPNPDEDRIAALAGLMDRWLDLFESLLTDRDWLLGDELTAADFAAYPFVKFAAGRDEGDDELFHRILDEHQSVDRRQRLAAWIERISRLPQV